MDLTTLANAKQWLNISNDTDDDLLTRLISAASGFIETYLSRSLGSQDYVETRDGHGGRVMTFREYPVTAVAGVAVDGVSIPPAPDTRTPGYRFSERRVILQRYRFRQGWGNVVLSYTAGYAAAPLDLEQACIELVSWRYMERQHIGQSGKSLEGANVTYSVSDLPPDVRTILDRHRRVALV